MASRPNLEHNTHSTMTRMTGYPELYTWMMIWVAKKKQFFKMQIGTQLTELFFFSNYDDALRIQICARKENSPIFL